MNIQTINGVEIAGNQHLAIVISVDDAQKTATFSAHTFYRNGEDAGAFDQAVKWARRLEPQ